VSLPLQIYSHASVDLVHVVSLARSRNRSEKDLIEDGKQDMDRAVFRLISRNATLGEHKATDEELLQELLDYMKDAFESDLADLEDDASSSSYEDYQVLYPKFMKAIQRKADKLKKDSQGYRQICLMPTFALGLVMVSRVRSHYIHAKWFKIGSLNRMVYIHGGVSASTSCLVRRVRL
jgi:hypothetical protein